jgi:alpha/beta superfamily hydrolase
MGQAASVIGASRNLSEPAPAASVPGLRARAVYLPCGTDRVFGFYHPAQGQHGATAALLCPPFGNGELCSYRARRDWAMHLARAGHATLRIDLAGTGDSSGGPHDRGLADKWLRALGEAAAWLRAEAQPASVTAIGIGLGGLLACAAVAGEAAIDDLVLWAVPSRGRTLVRELRAFSRLEDAVLLDEHAAPDLAGEEAADGSLQSGGFVMSAETVAALEAVDLTALELPDAGGRRVLMLERDGLDVDERLRSFLARTGAAVSVAAGPGYGRMMAEPYESQPPTEVFAYVGDWLSAREPRRRGQQAAIAQVEAAVPAEASPASAEIELAPDGTSVRESSVTVEHPRGRLFGVLAEPIGSPPQPLCVVFLNAGVIRRIGPNRMWVEAARRFAARGVPTVRMDLAGIGDADGDDSGWADDANLHVPAFVEQAREVIDALLDRGLPARFVLAGLCSGAYWSFQAALEDERVVGALLVNPRVLFWDGRRALLEEAGHAHKLLEGRLWMKLAHGGFSRERLAGFAHAILALLARAPARIAARGHSTISGGDRVDHALDRLERAGKHLAIVFGPREQLRLELERDDRLDTLATRANVTVDLIEGSSEVHTLEPLPLQQQVHALLDQALERELQRAHER